MIHPVAPICILNCLLSEQKASQIKGCLCLETVTKGWRRRGQGHLYGPRCAGQGKGVNTDKRMMVIGSDKVINGHNDIYI